MSSGSEESRARSLADLARALRELNRLGVSLYKAAAARLGLTDTDVQVLDILQSGGPATAGQLAELTGLTTGAITGMLNRLEQAGLVRRERDPEDGRRIIVRLVPEQEKLRELGALFADLAGAWTDSAAQYDEGQLAMLLAFLTDGNALARQELARLRAAPQEGEGVYSAPLGELTSARLVVPAGILRLTLRAEGDRAALYRAHFEGPVPEVKSRDGVVTIRYPRRLWRPGAAKSAADVSLNASVPWWIALQGGASDVTAELGGIKLAGLEVKGGMNMVRLELPEPEGTVPIQLSGGASSVVMRRPAGVAARVHLKGWASTFVFDEQRFSYLGNDVRLQSPGYETADRRYDIEVASSVSTVTITTSTMSTAG